MVFRSVQTPNVKLILRSIDLVEAGYSTNHINTTLQYLVYKFLSYSSRNL